MDFDADGGSLLLGERVVAQGDQGNDKRAGRDQGKGQAQEKQGALGLHGAE